MILISWNIQWGRGCDGRVDLERIVRTARALGDFDVLCLQEVADNYPGLAAAGDANQFAGLASLLSGYHAFEATPVERFTEGIGRQRFGNMVFTRSAPHQVLRHQLPWPADPAHPSMPRMALEVVLPTRAGPLRVMTTHLEYYAPLQRAAQVEALRALQQEASGHAAARPHPRKSGMPFETRPRASRAVLCGDFNCDAGDPQIARLQQPAGDAPGWRDAWTLAQPGTPHPGTVGVHDRRQWPEGARCFDFFFVSSDLAGAVRRMAVDAETQASDHQPVLLELAA